MQSEITRNTSKPRRNVPPRRVWRNGRIMARPEGSKADWRVIDAMNTENAAAFAEANHAALEALVATKLAMWTGHAHDINGAFRGWEFKADWYV